MDKSLHRHVIDELKPRYVKTKKVADCGYFIGTVLGIGDRSSNDLVIHVFNHPQDMFIVRNIRDVTFLADEEEAALLILGDQ